MLVWSVEAMEDAMSKWNLFFRGLFKITIIMFFIDF